MAAGWPDKDDQELLALIQDGSHQAFAELVSGIPSAFTGLLIAMCKIGKRRKTLSRMLFLDYGKIRLPGSRIGIASLPPGFIASW